jgi:hypothetical protein
MVRYKMVGRDVNSIPTQYRTWVVENTPDFTGSLYTGPKSGSNPMVDISAYAILDDDAVVDFNLPVPGNWQTNTPNLPFDFYGRRVLPDVVSDGSLAIIDGYIYIFGGSGSDAIYMASVGDPGTWTNTGAALPTTLANSSLAIVDGNIYLFGGNVVSSNGSHHPTNAIFTAPVSNPLLWTTVGSLPIAVHSASLGMANGYLFLAGGNTGTAATDQVLMSATSNPVSWFVAGTLPVATYGSTIIQADGYWYLLGGESSPTNPSDNVLYSYVSNPSVWMTYGTMPYATSYGAFFSMGQDGYYIGSAANDGYDAATTFTPIMQVGFTSLDPWTDTGQTVPAVLSHSQYAIIVDRFWFFGGSGLSAIFTNAQVLKYSLTDPVVIAYGNITRTLFQSADNLTNPFLVLGIPYWLTDYQM